MYADIVFLENAVIDGALLWTAGRLCGLPVKWLRLVAAAVLGGVWAVAAMAFPDIPLTSFWCKMPLSIGFVALAIPCGRFRRYLKALLLFYGLSILAGGIAWLLGLWAAGWPSDGRIPGWPMGTVGASAVAVAVAMALLCALYQHVFQTASREAFRCGVRIRLGERWVELTGYLDTGNQLRDPASGHPVILIHPSVAAELLDIDGSLPPADLIDAVRSHPRSRCTSIPYRAVGTEQGHLVGLFADDICLSRRDGSEQQAVAVLGLTPTPFWTGDFQALLPPGLAG